MVRPSPILTASSTRVWTQVLRRAIDLREDDDMDRDAFTTLIREAVNLNRAKRAAKSKR